MTADRGATAEGPASARPAGRGARARSCRAIGVAVAVLLGAGQVAAGCAGGDDGASASTVVPTASVTPSTTSTTAPSLSLLTSACGGTAKVVDAGTIRSPEITEASGLVAGRRQVAGGEEMPWWVHNDSGDRARVYAVDDAGTQLATVVLDGVPNRDWEDIAAGPGTERSSPPLLYVGDIGNNQVVGGGFSDRDTVRIQRFEEPEVPAAEPTAGSGSATPAAPAAAVAPVAPEAAVAPVLSVKADTIELRYPDGPHDAEAMLVDPISGDLVLITKDWTLQGRAGVYRVRGIAELAPGTHTMLEPAATIRLPPGTLVTGADVTPDGSVVALRSYGAVDLYRRKTDEPLWSAFETPPCAGPVPDERQGEAVGFAPDGGSYLTVSEGKDPVLHRTTP